MLHRTLIILVLILSLTTVAAAQDWDKFEFRATELAEGLYLLRCAGGNVVLSAGEDGPLLVDADYKELRSKLPAKVRELTGRDPAFCVNTHWHFDHTGGNAALRAGGCRVIAHDNVRRQMAAGAHIDIIDHDQPPAASEELPTVTFTDSLQLHWNGEEILIFHLPHAHTGGDAAVFFRHANVVHTGDIVFNCGYPFIDVNCGGSIDGVIAAVAVIIELCDEETKVVPGHGPLAGRADLQTYLEMLQAFRVAVAGQKAAGRDLAGVLESGATAELDEKWGGIFFPPDQFTEMVLRTLDRY